PARSSSASTSVVLPTPPCPSSATSRIRSVLTASMPSPPRLDEGEVSKARASVPRRSGTSVRRPLPSDDHDALGQVVVDVAQRLHRGVGRRRPDEAEAAPPQVLRE